VKKELIEKVVEEARNEEANLVIWDRRDTFTVEAEDLPELEMADGHLQAKMQDGRATVYVEYDLIYKLVVEKERKSRSGARAGFGASAD
jgi:hypothetical protein